MSSVFIFLNDAIFFYKSKYQSAFKIPQAI